MTLPARTVYVAVASSGIEAACLGHGGLDAFLSPAEAASAGRFRRPADRLDYSASHALFRLLAARQLGLGPGAAAGLEVRRRCSGCGGTDHGKPEIEGTGLSLSRSHGAVMAAAGPAGASLGADLEKIPASVFDGFDDFAVAPGELAGHDGSGEGSAEDDKKDDDAARMRLWVAKEAVLKAAGLGLSLEPASLRLLPSGSPGVYRTECPHHAPVHGMLSCAVPAAAGYAAAVAAHAGLPPQRLSLAEIFAT
ncbi:4'-phosphopantetheinyl transferase superfamily protein [Arthrobacter sp. UYCu712]|uniref:4'-phosphopantetheinyl transferase family protein n=1 Tax=Arthrobacter sp. UYCu712 TaxID=3156340 RepID=UPI003390C0C1